MSNIERKVTKIGNSYGVTIPVEMLKEAGISYGDNVYLNVDKGKITVHKKEEIKLPKGISTDFFETLERNTIKHKETLRKLVDR